MLASASKGYIKEFMCGIIGIVGTEQTSEKLISALHRLEYRGYDSAGIATVNNGKIDVRKVIGKIQNLQKEVIDNPISGSIGIGHTRWATHGVPAVRNAHPIQTKGVCVVHNGIIENHKKLREELKEKGYKFNSETDTEVISCLIASFIDEGLNEEEAAARAAKLLEGAFATAIIFSSNDNLMIGMKKGSPLAVGIAQGQMYLGSDAVALGQFTNRVIYLEDGDMVILNKDSFHINDSKGNKQNRSIKIVSAGEASISKDGYKHFMYKEIFEQPQVLTRTFNNYYDTTLEKFKFDFLAVDLASIERIYIVACGTSYYSACVAKYWFEQYANVPVEVDIASEFRYRSPVMIKNSLAIFISQSGETIDTLWALKHVNNQHKSHNVALVNVVESSIANAADAVLPLYAGYEIGVASTKAFTANLMVLSLLSLCIAEKRGTVDHAEIKKILEELSEISGKTNQVLGSSQEILSLAKRISSSQGIIFMGRGVSYPVSREGALKLKELSYIHAEGIAAGELKHGTIALIDQNLPVITIAPSDKLLTKTISNVQEIQTRQGQIIVFTDKKGEEELKQLTQEIIVLPETSVFTSPIIYTTALQLFAYHVANCLGKDVDQPRNLAKSVTVE